MRPLVFLLLLCACGGGNSTAPATSPTAATNPAIFPGECVLRCENLRPQLVQDFGYVAVDCGRREIVGALSNAECSCAFEKHFGVRLHGSFAEPLRAPSACP